MPNKIHPGSRWFWCEIHQTKRRRTPVKCTRKIIHGSINRLGRCAILRHHIGVELRGNMSRHLHARVHKKYSKNTSMKHPTRPQHSPYVIAPKKYGKHAHDQLPPDESPPVSKEKIKRIQGVVGRILFYARSVDSTFLVGLNAIAIQQKSATENTLKRTE